MELAQNLQPVAALVGTWEGDGLGSYPTIKDFTYREELTFQDIGKPFLQYSQRSWNTEGKLMHVESGYLRITSATTAELVIAVPTGQTELLEGAVNTEGPLQLALAGRIMNTSSAKQVDATTRSYTLDGEALQTEFHMAAVGVEMTIHLRSTLARKC